MISVDQDLLDFHTRSWHYYLLSLCVVTTRHFETFSDSLHAVLLIDVFMMFAFVLLSQLAKVKRIDSLALWFLAFISRFQVFSCSERNVNVAAFLAV